MRFLFIYETRGTHTRVRLFVGPDAEHFARAGEFTLRTEEWIELVQVLDAGRTVAIESFAGPVPLIDMREADEGEPAAEIIRSPSDYGIDQISSRHVAKNSGPE